MRFMPPVVHSTRKFTWTKKTQLFSAEASDFGPFSEVFNKFYGSEGFELVSAVTGDTLICLLEQVDRDDEGDIVGWYFKPTFMKLAGGKMKPIQVDYRVLIIND